MRTEINHATAEKYIEDYLAYSGQPLEDWDIDMAANILVDRCYENSGWEPDYSQTIDKDQAVDEDGKACYGSYHFAFNGTCPVQSQIFMADDMEEFAKTW